MTKWPAEGTFDVALCEEMETLIKKKDLLLLPSQG